MCFYRFGRRGEVWTNNCVQYSHKVCPGSICPGPRPLPSPHRGPGPCSGPYSGLYTLKHDSTLFIESFVNVNASCSCASSSPWLWVHFGLAVIIYAIGYFLMRFYSTHTTVPDERTSPVRRYAPYSIHSLSREQRDDCRSDNFRRSLHSSFLALLSTPLYRMVSKDCARRDEHMGKFRHQHTTVFTECMSMQTPNYCEYYSFDRSIRYTNKNNTSILVMIIMIDSIVANPLGTVTDSIEFDTAASTSLLVCSLHSTAVPVHSTSFHYISFHFLYLLQKLSTECDMISSSTA